MKYIYIWLSIHIMASLLSGCQYGQIEYMDITGYEDWDETYTLKNNHVYYLDADAVDDSGDGITEGTAWKTFAKVQSVMTSGDTIHIKAGNYGIFTDPGSPVRTDWITFIADESGVIFTSLLIDYKAKTKAYIRLDGITFSIVNGNDPYIHTVGVSLRDVEFFELRNCEIYHTVSKYLLSNGVRIADSENILLYHNHMHAMTTAIVAVGSKNVTISQNHIHELAEGCGLIYEDQSSNFIVELNNIYDSNEVYPDVDGYNIGYTHSASVEVKSSDILIRNNNFHGIGSSQGLSIQGPNDGNLNDVRSNIIFENNLVYDPHNTTFTISNLGENVIVRNNTFIGRLRNTDNPAMRLYIAFQVKSLSNGYDGSGLYVYNNIAAGVVVIPKTSTIINNIFWSFYYYNDDWNYQSSIKGKAIKNNVIVTSAISGAIPDYFISGFFNGITSFDDFTQRHNLVKDFTLSTNSPASNSGYQGYFPVDSLGQIDVSGFIQEGKKRSDPDNSIGCYED